MAGGPLESVTCRDFILPALAAAGWTPEQVVEQYELQNPESEYAVRHSRGELRVADYVLEVDGVPVGVIEAKRLHASAADGMGQAIDYAQRLEVPFAFASNGRDILLHDRHAGTERAVDSLPSPDDLWSAFAEGRGLTPRAELTSRVPYNRQLRAHGGSEVRAPRYYQRVAIQRTIEALDDGRKRVLLLMATGTGKTFTALQLVHKLREASKQLDGGQPYRVLYLADRDILVDDPRREFDAAFGGQSIVRVAKHSVTKSRELYFATYQAIDGDSASDVDGGGTPTSVFESFPRDFFSLVIVDECHRGSASSDSEWRKILDYFDEAVQVGLTATPKRDTNVDTYEYFGEPVFEYSLRQGIEDGFLAPYRVRRVILDVDALGWESVPGQLDVDGREVPEGIYTTPDFERRLSLPDRTAAMAQHLVGLLRETPNARAVVFCVSGAHAYEMKRTLLNADPDKTRDDPEWAVRIVGVEPDRARLLEDMKDPERSSPQVATTMRMLSTGVDMQDLRFVVLCRPVGSMVEFKQIVGRGTRLYPPKNKQFFEVVDYTGASAKFDDPQFDGPLLAPRTERVSDDGTVTVDDPGEDPLAGPNDGDLLVEVAEGEAPFTVELGGEVDSGELPVRILTVEDQQIEVLGERVRVVDAASGTLRTIELRVYARERVRAIFPSVGELREVWADAELRGDLLRELDAGGIDVEFLASHLDAAASDPFDVLASVAWDLPPQTRKERAERVRVTHAERIAVLRDAAREVIDVLLDRYAEHGVDELATAALQVPPLTELGTPVELAAAFGGPVRLRSWLVDLQRWLYEDSRST